MEQKLNVRVLDFHKLWEAAIINVWKLMELLRFKFIYYKVISGRGSEFDRLREYAEGDDAKFIDWNSFARTGKPHVKVFKEERMLDVIFVVDVSSTMVLGTTELVKNEIASLITTTLALASQTLGDKVCLLAVSDEIKAFIEPSITMETVLQIAKVLTNKKIYGGKNRWDIITHTVLETFGPDTFVFILSDFIMSEKDKIDMFDFVTKASNRFKGVAGIMIRDPFDSYIPEGIGKIYMQDPISGEIMLVDADKIREEFNKKAEEEEKAIEHKFLSTGSLFTKVLTTEYDVPDIIMRLFGGKTWK